MHQFSPKKIVVAALAFAALGLGASAFAGGTAKVFNKAIIGSVDYGFMGYVDKEGNFVNVTGEKILGAWAEVQFTPAQRRDSTLFTMQMLVPVEGAPEQVFTIYAKDLIPLGKGRYRAELTSTQFNGIVRAGRYSVETFGTDENGERVPLHGSLSESTGFHFIVTRPE